jgi:hypothetical protein
VVRGDSKQRLGLSVESCKQQTKGLLLFQNGICSQAPANPLVRGVVESTVDQFSDMHIQPRKIPKYKSPTQSKYKLRTLISPAQTRSPRPARPFADLLMAPVHVRFLLPTIDQSTNNSSTPHGINIGLSEDEMTVNLDKSPIQIPILEYSTRTRSWTTFENQVTDPSLPSLPPGARKLNIV